MPPRRRARRACALCATAAASLRRPRDGSALCQECFLRKFEDETHEVIVGEGLFREGQRVAIGASGGKDSTVLAHVLSVLNERHKYGIELLLLSADEGIKGYRDDSLACVKRNAEQYGLPLTILSYDQLYEGWTMDRIVAQEGRRGNCTYCGVFRRQALDRGAALLKADLIATGHNADDVAETVLMNLLRGDMSRLSRCTAITTGSGKEDVVATEKAAESHCGGDEDADGLAQEGGAIGTIPRCKPLMYAYEKEIVLYAYFKKLDYFSTECIYSPNAYRGFARDFLQDLLTARPSAILDTIHSGQRMHLAPAAKSALPSRGSCGRCGYLTSQKLCQACVHLDRLNRGSAKVHVESENAARLG